MGPSSGKQKNKSGYNSPLPPHSSLQLLKWSWFFYDSLKLKKSKKILKKIVISTAINFSLFWNSFCCPYM